MRHAKKPKYLAKSQASYRKNACIAFLSYSLGVVHNYQCYFLSANSRQGRTHPPTPKLSAILVFCDFRCIFKGVYPWHSIYHHLCVSGWFLRYILTLYFVQNYRKTYKIIVYFSFLLSKPARLSYIFSVFAQNLPPTNY